MRSLRFFVLICLAGISGITAAQPPLQWANSMGFTGLDIGYFCGVDGSGNSFVCGNFTSTVDFELYPKPKTHLPLS